MKEAARQEAALATLR